MVYTHFCVPQHFEDGKEHSINECMNELMNEWTMADL